MIEWEICTFEDIIVKEETKTLFSKSPALVRWVVKIISPKGVKILYQSDDFESPYHILATDSRKDKMKQQLQGNFYRARDDLVSRLISEGWEPASFNEIGVIMTLKRQINTVKSENQSTPSELLLQLSNLRNKGILTEQEYETKKAEILKRM
jgi:hypothetical protein